MDFIRMGDIARCSIGKENELYNEDLLYKLFGVNAELLDRSCLGYDALVGMAIVFIGGNAGYTAGIFNPFNVGVAQSIAELDAFSGSWYRWILLAVLLVVSSIGITRYAVRVKKDPTRSVVYGTGNTESWHTELDLSAKATSKEYMGLAAFVIGFGFLIWGASSQDGGFGQFSAVFFWIAVVTGAIYGYSLNQWAGYFVDGMKDMVSGAWQSVLQRRYHSTADLMALDFWPGNILYLWNALLCRGREEARVLLLAEFDDYYIGCTHLSLTPEDQLASLDVVRKIASRLDKPFFAGRRLECSS